MYFHSHNIYYPYLILDTHRARPEVTIVPYCTMGRRSGLYARKLVKEGGFLKEKVSEEGRKGGRAGETKRNINIVRRSKKLKEGSSFDEDTSIHPLECPLSISISNE